MEDWVNATPPVPFKELRAPVEGDHPILILPPITSSLIRILFNDNPARTFANDLRGFVDEIPFTGAIPDDPPTAPGFTWERLRRNLEGLVPYYDAVREFLAADPPAVVDRALFVTWAKKVIGYTSDCFREDAARAPARIGLLGSDADDRIIDRVTIKVPLSPPPSAASSPGYDSEDVRHRWVSSSGSPDSRGHPSIPPSAAGSPGSAAGDPVNAGGRRRRTRTQRVLRTRTRTRTQRVLRTRTRRAKKRTPR